MVRTFSNGLLGSNAFVVYDNSEAMLVDCGVEPSKIALFLKENELSLKYIVLTHGHFDHSHYVAQYESLFPSAKVICHASELIVLSDPEANASALFYSPLSYSCDFCTVCDGDELLVGELRFVVLHTPGHSPGGICLYCDSEKILFGGDMLFFRGIGRTDLKHGSRIEMAKSLDKILMLDEEVTVYTGHASPTKIGWERH